MRDAGHDAVVVGSGPNGLAAAITLARAGRSVVVYEAATTWGGGLRTEELTLPGFRHDVCATAFPLAAASPFFRQLSLEDYGLSWVHPDAPLAHPLDDGTAVVLERSVAATAAGLGSDGAAWERIFGALSARAEMLAHDLLGPLRVPRHPVALARFGVLGLLPARTLARTVFSGERARALFAGLAAHSMLALDQPVSAAIGLVLGMYAHAVGWPFVRGGAQALADALVACLRAAGGDVVTNHPVESVDALPAARQVLLDLTPRQVVALAGERLRPRARPRLRRDR
ncbi:NAD(P)/FAD-dependent oxidoreductase [Sphaerobacter sp.]|uniref:phytoene desaturase family protein n=1 Tax=Sphaerobacter sp. TaxID=2099654 RepID=UPI0025E0605F|nr:NAD(P)/FAD-dependent oxidoreductase [Sphaerobacter sp.]